MCFKAEAGARSRAAAEKIEKLQAEAARTRDELVSAASRLRMQCVTIFEFATEFLRN